MGRFILENSTGINKTRIFLISKFRANNSELFIKQTNDSVTDFILNEGKKID